MASRPDDSPSRAFKATRRFKAEANALGRRVRRLRLRNRWTLEQAAERMHMDLKHLQKIESGQINLTLVTLVRIAEGLGEPVRVLFSGK